MKKKLIVSLDEKNIALLLVGGKALNLAKLKQAGFNVPDGFVITTETRGKITNELKKMILVNFKHLGVKKVSVRSSATVEDRHWASFAGQFDSYLGVTEKELMKNIKKCFASATNERILAYLKFKKISPRAVKMAVIIQTMVFAEKGGVIFTADVFRQRKSVMVIEAAQGLGENVVSGLVNPERVMVEKKSGGIVERHLIDGPILTEKEIKELTKIAVKIEDFYRSPQDIEWAIMEDKIYILQSRPITR